MSLQFGIMESVAFGVVVLVGLLFTIVSGKDASTQTVERLTMLEELKNLEVIDYIRAGALTSGFRRHHCCMDEEHG